MTEESNASGLRTVAVRPMLARNREEEHRASTPLELFFDLCFVVAVAQGGSQLAHALAAGRVGQGLYGYVFVFFAVWWAWMNFAWFASAYDNDDVAYRVATLVQITGVLILAAGVPRLFEDHVAVGVLGYVVMRCVMIAQWLRAGANCAGLERGMARRYAAGIAFVQVCWVLLVFVPRTVVTPLVLLFIAFELAVPLIAEHRFQTSWHPEHIAERYGLFTLIVLGETVSAATVAVQSGLDEQDALGRMLPIAGGGLLICFSAWWIYFARPVHDYLRSNRQAFLWGYGHYVVLGSAAAIGAGLQVAVEQAVGKAEISATAAAAGVTVPTALFFLAVWALHARHGKVGAQQAVLPVTAIAVVAVTPLGGPAAVLAAGAVCAAALATGLVLHLRARN